MSCGSCTLCCKVLAVKEIGKPPHVACKHVAYGGCKIYAARPESCKIFKCVWLQSNDGDIPGNLPPYLKPERCGFVIWQAPGTTILTINCDGNRPDCWKEGRAGRFLAALSRQTRLVIDNGQDQYWIMKDGVIERAIVTPPNDLGVRTVYGMT